MSSKEKGLLWVARGGMEICWLYAWATFSMYALLHKPFPMPEAMGAFVLAILITLYVQGRGWRIVLILVIQLAGLALAVSRILYAFTPQLYSYFSREWIVVFMNQSRGPVDWMTIIIILSFALLFWVNGVLTARRSDAYFALCTRFDLGVAAFFGLLLLKLLLRIKGGIHVPDPMSEFLLFPFFIFSLLAIGIAGKGHHIQKDFISGFQGIGWIISFSIIVLGFGGGVVMLFLPYLTRAAEVGYGALKTVVGPLSPILIAVIRFLFTPRGRILSEPSPSTKGAEGIDLHDLSEPNWWNMLIEKILAWSLVSLGVLVFSIIACIGVYYLVRWLFSRSVPREIKQGKIFSFRIILRRLREILCLVQLWIMGRIRGYGNGIQLFNAVIAWGRWSGISRFVNETPLEYASRLQNGFPVLRQEIETIVEAHNRELYGGITLTQEALKVALKAWKRLRSPRYWPSRFKSLLIG